MRVARGPVVGGKIVIDDLPLPEGGEVAVCFDEDDCSALSPEVREGLAAAMAQLDRGEGVSADELFDRLTARRPG